MIELATNTITADNKIGIHNAVSATMCALLRYSLYRHRLQVKNGGWPEICPQPTLTPHKSQRFLVRRYSTRKIQKHTCRTCPQREFLVLVQIGFFGSVVRTEPCTPVRIARYPNGHFSLSGSSQAALASHASRAHPSRAFRVHQFRGPRKPFGSCAPVENRTGAIRAEARNPARRILLELRPLSDRSRLAC